MFMTRQHQADPALEQQFQHIACIVNHVALAPSARNGQQMVVKGEDFKVVGMLEEGVFDPRVAAPADAAVIEIGLGGIHPKQCNAVFANDMVVTAPDALKMRVADVAAVVVAGHDEHIRTGETLQILRRLPILLPVPHIGEVAGDYHHIWGQVVDLNQGPIKEVRHKILRPGV